LVNFSIPGALIRPMRTDGTARSRSGTVIVLGDS
jgi:hypothetical protein